MKKSIKAIIAAVLCLCIVMPTAALAQTADEESYNSVEEYVALTNEAADDGLQTKLFFAKLLNKLSNFFINSVLANVLNAVIPDSAAVADYEEFDISKYDNFYAGMDEFIDEPQGDKVWSLGYGKASVLPADFGTKKYAKGAYLPYVFGNSMYTDEDGVEEDLMVRTVVMDDGSGRGKVVFIALDAMGFANADVRLVREGLEEIAEKYNIVSINVSCTHIHTGIDSQGVWTDPIGCIVNNIFSDDVKYGVERSFIDAVVKGSVKSVEQALENMTTGKLYYAKTDVDDYVHDRTAPIAYDPYLYKLEFIPFDESATPTIIATYGCHPESASYDWASADPDKAIAFDTKFTPDFIWHAEKVINSAGYNFIYIQGNVSTVTSSRGLTGDGIDEFPCNAHYTSVRYGYEIGYIILGMSMTTEERIALNEATGDRLDVAVYANNPDYPNYTVWYEGRETVESVEVEPVLNVKHKQFTVRIDNNIITLLGKTSVADNFVLKDDNGRYYTVSEVGYLEIGDEMKVYMSPGETFGELFLGGSGAEGFELKPIRERTGEDIIVMDLMNDAAGYVANPENYVLAGLQYNEASGEFDSDTWCLISYGKGAATAFIGAFYEIYDSVR